MVEEQITNLRLEALRLSVQCFSAVGTPPSRSKHVIALADVFLTWLKIEDKETNELE